MAAATKCQHPKMTEKEIKDTGRSRSGELGKRNRITWLLVSITMIYIVLHWDLELLNFNIAQSEIIVITLKIQTYQMGGVSVKLETTKRK